MASPACEDVPTFLRSIIYYDHEKALLAKFGAAASGSLHLEAASDWGKRALAAEQKGRFPNMPYSHEFSAKVPVLQGSFAEKQPELMKIADDLSFFQLNPNVLRETALRQKFTKAELQAFYLSRLDLLEDALTEVSKHLEKIAPERVLEFSWAKQKKLKDLEQQILRLDQSRDMKEVFRHGEHIDASLRGTAGELKAFFSMPNVKALDRYFNEIRGIKDLVKKHLDTVEHSLLDGTLTLKQLSEKYPRLFYPYTADLPLEKIPDYFRKFRGKFLRKEVDLVRVENGKFIWTEVKSGRYQLSFEKFSEHNKSEVWVNGADSFIEKDMKSALTQLLEMKEAIEFVGIRGVQLEFYAFGGVDDRVREWLKAHDIRLITTP